MKNKLCFAFLLILFTLFSITSVFAQVTIPDNYGARGALQDTSITLKEALTYAIQDEYLAQARYDSILKKFGDIRPFNQIKLAEQRHISALLPLFQKYNISVPADDAKQYVVSPETLKEAFQAGVDAEIENIEMYEKLASITEFPQDVRAVFQNLGDASRNHLEAFRRGLSRN